MGVVQNLMALVTLKDNTQSGTRSVVNNLNRIANALDVTHLAATKTFKIDSDIRRMGVQMGLASGLMSKMSMSVLGIANATGLSTEKITEMTTAYMAIGNAMDTTTEKGVAHAEMVAELVGRFGMAPAEVARTDVTFRRLGGSLEKLTDQVTSWQDQFDMPGMLAQMPAAVRFADQMLTRFGRSTVGNANSIVEATLKMGASFAKTFGVDMAEAVGLASRQQEHFFDQIQQNKDVFLGLSDDFSGLSKAFFETGRGLDEVNRLMKLGQEDPAAYAREVLKIRDNFIHLGQGYFAERFFQNVIRNSDEATRRLLTNKNALEELERANEAAEISKGFNQLVESMRSIGSEVITTVSNLMFLSKTIIGLTFADEVIDAFSGITNKLKQFNVYLTDLAKQIKDSAFFKQIRPILVGIGKVLIGVGAAAGMVASTFASLVIPFRTFTILAEKLPLIGKGVTPIRVLFEVVKDFLSSGLNFSVTLGAMGAALNDFGKALKDPNLSVSETILRGIRALSVGTVDAIDTALGGIPTRIAKVFFPEMEDTLGEGLRNIFRDLQLILRGSSRSMVGGWWKTIKEETKKKFGEFVDYMRFNFTEMQRDAETWGQNIGRAIGTMTKWAVDLISPLFSAEKWRGWFQAIGDYIRGPGSIEIQGPFEEIFAMLLQHGKTFAVNFIDEALRPFGKGFIEVKDSFLDLYDAIRIKFNWLKTEAWPELQMRWLETKVSFIKGFYQIKDAAAFAFDLITSHASRTIGLAGKFIAQIRKYLAEREEKKALEVYRDVSTTSWATDAQKAAATERARAAVTEAREAREQYASFEELAAVGRKGLAEIYDEKSKREEQSKKEADELIGDSEERLKYLRAHYADWTNENKAFAANIEAEAAKRHGASLEAIAAREGERRPDDMQRIIDSLLTRAASDPIEAKVDAIFGVINSSLAEIRTTNDQGLIRNFESYVSDFNRIRLKLADAQTPEEVNTIWNELKQFLSGTDYGKAVAKEARLGERELAQTAYERPDPYKSTSAFVPRSTKEEEFLATLRDLMNKKAAAEAWSAQAQAEAAAGHAGMAEQLLLAVRRLTEAARHLAESTQGASVAVGPGGG